jgi:thiamine biosynthesis lipoprotein
MSMLTQARERSDTELAKKTLQSLGTTAVVVVTRPALAERALAILREELEAIDLACSRFRPDSELLRLQGARGSTTKVSPLLFDALHISIEVARRTSGAVDPTVGIAIEAIGYDRDFAQVARDGSALGRRSRRVPGWRMIELDPDELTALIPPGVRVDLGASAKALAADLAAARIAAELDTGVLVSIGGDVAVAGGAPAGGWAIGIAPDSSTPTGLVDQVVSICSGGLASSSTQVRAWRRGRRNYHHIIDPATGSSAEPHWVLVSASGGSCVEANAASTACVVWGPSAIAKLEELGQPARLVRHDGAVVTVNGWPKDESGVAVSARTSS